ncbi:DNA cytosine methyltransferase [Streptomyces marianii]|uniref:DNA (cytosine-5-)-methyltransferase n=1 Tax=Streptomyces marianii TaxID=1817406 RepID=A0A5R9E8D5_9ACTN|nr:DNA cytosine methyltransferase [Streptomyces marianii]TLQ45052.1 DNA cytosine methyltransferase [Streptomyces marianii]
MKRTSVELFAGGGGLAMAVERAGFRPLLLNEFNKRACETLAANGAEVCKEGERPRVPRGAARPPLVEGDIRKLDMDYLKGEVDVLAGGPPCQPFSLGGVAKGDEDQRNMFPEMFRAVREIQPKAVICENVRGLLRPSFKPYFNYILRELELPFEERREGTTWQEHDQALRVQGEVPAADLSKRYKAVMIPVNAADYGVPQIRNRVIIVAFRADLRVDIDEFKRLVSPTHSETALLRSFADGTYWRNHPDVPDHVRARVMRRVPATLPIDDGLRPWRTMRDAIHGDGQLRLPTIPLDQQDKKREHGGIAYHVGWPNARIYDGHTPNELDRPAKTVKAGVHGVPGGESVMLLDDRVPDATEPDGWRYLHRYMTVRETARVMTFPDDWKLEGPRGEKMRQLGNAVPVLLGEAFAKAVAAALDGAERGR